MHPEAWLDSGDGRRRYFRRAAERVPVVAPRCRPVDHLLVALRPWARTSLQVGRSLVELMDGLRELRPAADLNVATEKLLRSMLRLELLGRPGLPEDLDLGTAIQCYRLKFLLEDFYLFLAAATCCVDKGEPGVLAERTPLRCQCAACLALWHVRSRYMFMGPAPRAFFGSVAEAEAGATFQIMAQVNEILNRRLHTSLCLYTLQCLPCTWREFIRQCQKYSGASASDLKDMDFKSGHRRLAEAVLRLEAARRKDLDAVLERHGLVGLFEGLPLQLQNRIFTGLRFGNDLQRGGLVRYFKAEARAEGLVWQKEWEEGGS